MTNPKKGHYNEVLDEDNLIKIETQKSNQRGRELLENLYKVYDERVKQHPEQERRERSQAAINGIADMGRALSNLYFTTQYAPNAYSESNSMSARTRERIAKAQAARDRDRDALMRYALTLDNMDENERSWKFRVAEARRAQQRAEEEKKAKEDRQQIEDQRYEDKVKRDEANAKADRDLKLEIARMSRSRSGGGGGGGGRSSSYKVIILDDGKELHIPTKRYNKTNLRTSWSKYDDMGREGDFDAWIGQNLDDPEVLEELFSLAGEDWDAYDNKPTPPATSSEETSSEEINSPRELIMNTLKEGKKQFTGKGKGY